MDLEVIMGRFDVRHSMEERWLGLADMSSTPRQWRPGARRGRSWGGGGVEDQRQQRRLRQERDTPCTTHQCRQDFRVTCNHVECGVH